MGPTSSFLRPCWGLCKAWSKPSRPSMPSSRPVSWSRSMWEACPIRTSQSLTKRCPLVELYFQRFDLKRMLLNFMPKQHRLSIMFAFECVQHVQSLRPPSILGGRMGSWDPIPWFHSPKFLDLTKSDGQDWQANPCDNSCVPWLHSLRFLVSVWPQANGFSGCCILGARRSPLPKLVLRSLDTLANETNMITGVPLLAYTFAPGHYLYVSPISTAPLIHHSRAPGMCSRWWRKGMSEPWVSEPWWPRGEILFRFGFWYRVWPHADQILYVICFDENKFGFFQPPAIVLDHHWNFKKQNIFQYIASY